jgi:Protein of unknown function (DUF3224)
METFRRMQLRNCALAVIGICLVPAFGVVRSRQAPASDLSKLLGDWTGESACVGNLPSCHDEKVIYHLSSTAPNKVTIAADKLVDGKPEPMGTLEFQYDAVKETLTGEFQNARYRARWVYTVKGSTMEGTLTLLPDDSIVRRVHVTKNNSDQKATTMNHANGTFDVKLNPQDDKSDDATLSRMTIEKQWHGDLEGTSRGQMLTAGTAVKNSAGYVAIEKVTGTLNGRKGTFVLQHDATMTRGDGQLNIIVVPDSGTDQLAGLSGKLTIKIENGKHFYALEYNLPN